MSTNLRDFRDSCAGSDEPLPAGPGSRGSGGRGLLALPQLPAWSLQSVTPGGIPAPSAFHARHESRTVQAGPSCSNRFPAFLLFTGGRWPRFPPGVTAAMTKASRNVRSRRPRPPAPPASEDTADSSLLERAGNVPGTPRTTPVPGAPEGGASLRSLSSRPGHCSRLRPGAFLPPPRSTPATKAEPSRQAPPVRTVFLHSCFSQAVDGRGFPRA
mgnify:CR=1 FL=1